MQSINNVLSEVTTVLQVIHGSIYLYHLMESGNFWVYVSEVTTATYSNSDKLKILIIIKNITNLYFFAPTFWKIIDGDVEV